MQTTPTKRAATPARGQNGYLVGENHHRAKLTDAQVEAIRQLHDVEGLSLSEIKGRLCLQASRSTIRDIVARRTRAAIVVSVGAPDRRGCADAPAERARAETAARRHAAALDLIGEAIAGWCITTKN